MKRFRVLFVCVGNICRSAMAEAMARKYGSDVIEPSSAGVAPAFRAHVLTRTVLQEINVDPGDHVPRSVADVDLSRIDLVVNMSGEDFDVREDCPLEVWDVEDPFGRSEADFRRVRADIEMKVMNLILRIRTGKLGRNGRNGIRRH